MNPDLSGRFGPIKYEPRRLRPPYTDRDPGRDQRYDLGETFEQWRERIDADALAALLEPLAGLPVSDYERRILHWLTGWGISTVAALAALLYRARAGAPLTEEQTR
jgi:hypothetical protein